MPIEVKAVTTAQMEAIQREEAERTRQAAAKRTEGTIAKLREEVVADKRGEERLRAKLAAIEKRQKLEASKHKRELLARALEQCKREPRRKRAQCKAKAEHRYGGPSERQLKA